MSTEIFQKRVDGIICPNCTYEINARLKRTAGVSAVKTSYIKRVIGVAGDHVKIENDDVYVNDNDETLHAEVEAAYVQIKQHHRDFLLRFIQGNPTSLSTIAAFYQKYDNCTFFNEKDDFNILNDVYNNLMKTYPDNENVKVLEKRL